VQDVVHIGEVLAEQRLIEYELRMSTSACTSTDEPPYSPAPSSCFRSDCPRQAVQEVQELATQTTAMTSAPRGDPGDVHRRLR
jgi:hypothetical protein